MEELDANKDLRKKVLIYKDHKVIEEKMKNN